MAPWKFISDANNSRIKHRKILMVVFFYFCRTFYEHLSAKNFIAFVLWKNFDADENFPLSSDVLLCRL